MDRARRGLPAGPATRLRALAAAAGAAVLVAGAAGDATPDVNRKVVAFAREHVGKTVGDGECTTLAVRALRAAGARGTPVNPGDGNYVWGRPVASFREALPGDVVQFRDAVFKGKRWVSSHRYVTWRYEYPHHTAIVAGVRDHGRLVSVLHQNVRPEGQDDGAQRVVSETLLRPESLQKGGKVWIYRPTPPGEDPPSGGPRPRRDNAEGNGS